MWGVCYLPRWWITVQCTALQILFKAWVMKMAIWWLLALVIVNTFQLSVKFQKSRTLRISKLWRQAKKETSQRDWEERVRNFGKQETIEFSQQGVMQCHSVEDHIEMRTEKKAFRRFFITNQCWGLLAYNSMFVLLFVLLFLLAKFSSIEYYDKPSLSIIWLPYY